MNLKQMYEFFVSNGIENDPRGKKEVNILLEEKNKEYNSLDEDKKKSFDVDSLKSPYNDTRIIYGSGEEKIQSVMVGIDIETPELLLANQLRLSGRKIDMVLAHHPEGKAYSTFHNVIAMQAEIMEGQGVPVNISEKLISSRVSEVGRSVAGSNHQRVFDAAKLLEIPMMTSHTVADNHVVTYLQTELNKIQPRYLKDIVSFLENIPEYKYAATFYNGPFILNGSEKSKCGKIFVDMTGGTEGPHEIIEKLADAGVGTIVGMHMSEKNYKAAEKHNINVVI
ncbi:MAG: hypothetical protein WC234_03845, partial [Endomicrobiaceae bacterium]